MTACVPCQPGRYASGGQCLFCPAGKYSNLAMATRCTNCPSGRYSDGENGNSICHACPSSTFSVGTGLSSPSCSGGDGSTAACPEGWIEKNFPSGEGGCFLASPVPLNWADAQQFCKTNNGNLASFSSREQVAYMGELCQTEHSGSDVRHTRSARLHLYTPHTISVLSPQCWTGLNRLLAGDVWNFADGQSTWKADPAVAPAGLWTSESAACQCHLPLPHECLNLHHRLTIWASGRKMRPDNLVRFHFNTALY